MSAEEPPPTDPPTADTGPPRGKKSTKLRAVTPPRATLPRGATRFQKGNKRQTPSNIARGAKSTNPVDQIDAIAKRTIANLERAAKIRTEEDLPLKVLMTAPAANAIFVGCRLRLDILSQFEIAKRLAEQAETIEGLRRQLRAMMAARGFGPLQP
jgi:hypothetical protein